MNVQEFKNVDLGPPGPRHVIAVDREGGVWVAGTDTDAGAQAPTIGECLRRLGVVMACETGEAKFIPHDEQGE